MKILVFLEEILIIFLITINNHFSDINTYGQNISKNKNYYSSV
jgi:hypothetical protein